MSRRSRSSRQRIRQRPFPQRPTPRDPHRRTPLSPYSLLPKERTHFVQILTLATFGLLIHYLWLPASLLSTFSALSVASVALTSVYFWCSGRIHGIPIFPLFALTHIPAYSYPLVSGHASTSWYSDFDHLGAAMKVTLFLTVATLFWFFSLSKLPRPPRRYRTMNEKMAVGFFLIPIGLAALLNMSVAGGWNLEIPGGMVSLLRGVVFGLNLLGVFVLSHRIGKKQLPGEKKFLFLTLFIVQLFAGAAALLLTLPAFTTVLAVTGYILGARKIPWKTMIVICLCFSVLQFGKNSMRDQQWNNSQTLGRTVQPWEYPRWFKFWAQHGMAHFTEQKPKDIYFRAVEKELMQGTSVLDRTSVIQMLLLAQDQVGWNIPYLYGKTYSILPQLLVPRIINPYKVRSHEGTIILSLHYGLQTADAIGKVTIGWGIIAEAYANFGIWGLILIGAIVGRLLGTISRWSLYTPILSARTLFAVIIMSIVIQTEWTAGVHVASISQATMVLVAVNIFVMHTRRYLSSRFSLENLPPRGRR